LNLQISVIGAGYVGCGNALLLATHNSVSLMDIDKKKVSDFNNNILPIRDSAGEALLRSGSLKIKATNDISHSVQGADFVILALPTNFNEQTLQYDTGMLDKVAEDVLKLNPETIIVIKSTVNIGYTDELQKKLNTNRIIFSPEFLREGHALEDNLNPSRIIIGNKKESGKKFGQLLVESSLQKDVEVLFMEARDAESVKLFSNTYLAMRVAFFNELDNFCIENDIDGANVIKGVSLDSRIGNFYNNPSFGFGGYCLPKDSKQLLQQFHDTPSHLIASIQNSNEQRKAFLAKKIIDLKVQNVGIYKLAMKAGSDNYRDSSVFGIINILIEAGIKIFIFDDSLDDFILDGATIINSLEDFIDQSDLIVTNRIDKKISTAKDKIFSRDIFSTDD
jgi:UDPglucose 6-dehydrogenase